jgi:hypothetical protein
MVLQGDIFTPERHSPRLCVEQATRQRSQSVLAARTWSQLAHGLAQENCRSSNTD